MGAVILEGNDDLKSLILSGSDNALLKYCRIMFEIGERKSMNISLTYKKIVDLDEFTRKIAISRMKRIEAKQSTNNLLFSVLGYLIAFLTAYANSIADLLGNNELLGSIVLTIFMGILLNSIINLVFQLRKQMVSAVYFRSLLEDLNQNI